jgi:hypothetical protein
VATLVGFLVPETDRVNGCFWRSYEAGRWLGNVGFVSFVILVIGVVMLVRHRSVLSAMLRGARGGAPVENVAPRRRIVIGPAIAIVVALLATAIAYAHMRGVIEDCV